jgi:hypothetical protein
LPLTVKPHELVFRTAAAWYPDIFFACVQLSIGAHAQPAAPASSCPAQAAWLSSSLKPDFAKPPTHGEGGSDCPFYMASWQNFLFAMQPDSSGKPLFLRDYLTIQQLFPGLNLTQFAAAQTGMLSLAPRTAQLPNDKTPLIASPARTKINDGFKQAGPAAGLLIDQNGYPVFYAIHVNDKYADFIRSNKLTTKAALLAADADKLEFQEGAVELKSAWKIVTPEMDRSAYYITKAIVPHLTVKNGDVVSDGRSDTVDVALLAIHVVFVLKGHPEFIWSTFEHVGDYGEGVRDNAPAASDIPSGVEPTKPVSAARWTLFKAGTLNSEANQPASAQDRVRMFDEATQRFVRNGAVLQTSVDRLFPASKSQGGEEDSDIVAVNVSMRENFRLAKLSAEGRRRNYQLVGAIWMDDPSQFRSNMFLHGQTTDTPGALIAGEDRLSITAMESFTQSEQAGFPNCFSCHNTKRVTDNDGKQIIPAKRLNVSHVLSKFLSEGD